MNYDKPKLISPNSGSLDINSALDGAIGKNKVFV